VDWDSNGTNDLLVGDVNGNVIIYKNTNTNTNPVLDSGTFVLNNADARATPIVYDWNGDGNKDLVVGTFTGQIQIYMNTGSNTNPTFSSYSNLQVGGTDFNLTAGDDRSSPRIVDWNGDGLKDILVGEYYGNVYYLENKGSNIAPAFDKAEKLLLADGTALRYLTDPFNPGSAPRSRLDVADWNNDGYADLLVGGSDGRVMLFTAVAPEPMSTTLFIVGSGVLGLSRMRKKFKEKNNKK